MNEQELRSLVREAVTRELVPIGYDPVNEPGIALGDPAEREERRARSVFVQQRENAVDIGLDATAHRIPLAARDVRREGGDLEVVLDVDREGVAHRHARKHGGRRAHHSVPARPPEGH